MHAPDFVNPFVHVDRDADGSALVGDGACDALADPPGGVGAELIAALVIEFIHGAHQSDVSFLNQVEEFQSGGPVSVLLGDADDEAEVRFDDGHFGILCVCFPPVNLLREFSELFSRNADFAGVLPNVALDADNLHASVLLFSGQFVAGKFCEPSVWHCVFLLQRACFLFPLADFSLRLLHQVRNFANFLPVYLQFIKRRDELGASPPCAVARLPVGLGGREPFFL